MPRAASGDRGASGRSSGSADPRQAVTPGVGDHRLDADARSRPQPRASSVPCAPCPSARRAGEEPLRLASPGHRGGRSLRYQDALPRRLPRRRSTPGRDHTSPHALMRRWSAQAPAVSPRCRRLRLLLAMAHPDALQSRDTPQRTCQVHGHQIINCVAGMSRTFPPFFPAFSHRGVRPAARRRNRRIKLGSPWKLEDTTVHAGRRRRRVCRRIQASRLPHRRRRPSSPRACRGLRRPRADGSSRSSARRSARQSRRRGDA